MSDWLKNYADELSVSAIGIEGVPKNALLDMARDVAHGTERKNAPLATYIAGLSVGAAVARGTDPEEAFKAALETAARLLGEGESESG